jgi:hypothetical protein
VATAFQKKRVLYFLLGENVFFQKKENLRQNISFSENRVTFCRLLAPKKKKEKRMITTRTSKAQEEEEEEEGKKISDDFVLFVQSWLDCRTILVNDKSKSCFVWFFGVYFSSSAS